MADFGVTGNLYFVLAGEYQRKVITLPCLEFRAEGSEARLQCSVLSVRRLAKFPGGGLFVAFLVAV